jgi:hypothetical protein
MPTLRSASGRRAPIAISSLSEDRGDSRGRDQDSGRSDVASVGRPVPVLYPSVREVDTSVGQHAAEAFVAHPHVPLAVPGHCSHENSFDPKAKLDSMLPIATAS